MIKINKGIEPAAWAAYRNTPGAAYAPNDDLRNALLSEQGYICAYCMRRIPVRDAGNNETSRIEHILSRQNHPDKQLDYDNMAVCCPGFINGEEHCDKSKHENDITIPIFNSRSQISITYSLMDGEIRSSNEIWQEEINTILHLNNAMLMNNRSQELIGVRLILEKRNWRKAELENKLQEWSNIGTNGRLKPYCGIVIWYLEKKLRQYR